MERLLLRLGCRTPRYVRRRHELRGSLSLHSSSAAATDLPPLDVSYPAFTVWGANTDIGKTLISAGLSSSLIRQGSRVLYVKPLQTGFPSDSDSDSVLRKVCQVLSASNGVSTPLERSLLSNCIRKVSPSITAISHIEQQKQRLKIPPQIQGLSGMDDLFRYTEVLLKGSHIDGGKWEIVNSGEGEYRDTPMVFVGTTLWSWFHAVSPHLAATKEGFAVTDFSVLQDLMNVLGKFPQVITNGPRTTGDFQKWAIVETAGGVASPGPSGTLQCDLYRPLRLPCLLVGDGKLGGISSTITAYESLLLRGYDIDAIVMLDNGLGNKEQLLAYLRHRVPVVALPALPQDASDNLTEWFLHSSGVFSHIQEILKEAYFKKLHRLQEMQKKGSELLWWPFTQHSLVSKNAVTVIDSRYGDKFMVYQREMESETTVQQFDGSASWWTQGPDPQLQQELARQIGYAAGRFGHVMLPENVYEPALRCAEILIQRVGKGWADRVYYSDNGSTAIEIAIKMAFRKYLKDHNLLADFHGRYGLKVLALKGSYHGDTLGAQEAQSPSAYTGYLQQPWYCGRGLFLKPPSIYMLNCQWHIEVPDWSIKIPGFPGNTLLSFPSRESLFDKKREDSYLAEVYKRFISKELFQPGDSQTRIAALIIEPVIHGASGMVLIDPLFQRLLIDQCKLQSIPVIFDEVFAGCWRLGVQSCAEILGRLPDIGCYSKLLTGGAVPLAVTLASSTVFDSFKGDSKLLALLHGHSYSGHAIGCQAAVTALEWFSNPATNSNLLACGKLLRELWNPATVSKISSHPAVQRVIALGTVFAVELKTNPSDTGYASLSSQSTIQALRKNGIYVRPIGNVVYLMCSPLTLPMACSKLLQELIQQLDAYESQAAETMKRAM